MLVNTWVIRAGQLRNRITIQQRVTQQDAAGQPVDSWVTLFTCWADVSPLTGRELLAAAAVQSSVTHAITVRYRPEFAVPKDVARMRVVFSGRYFNIHAALNQDERNRVVILRSEEGLNDG